MQKLFILICCSCFSLFLTAQQFPVAKKIPNSITKHAITVEDDYAWLENMQSTEVLDWVAKENEISNAHLAEMSKATNFSFKIKDYDFLSTNALPAKNKKYYYSMNMLDKKKPTWSIVIKTSCR